MVSPPCVRSALFTSRASNLVPGDTNGVRDVFVHDRRTGTTERVSVGSAGGQETLENFGGTGALSDDGRFVVFVSVSPLGFENPQGTRYVFVRDRAARTTERIGASASDTRVAICANGRFVTYCSPPSSFQLGPRGYNPGGDVLVLDRAAGTTEQVSPGDPGGGVFGGSGSPVISASGRFVAFEFSTFSYGWYEADDSWESIDSTPQRILVHDRDTATIEEVNVDSAGNAPSAHRDTQVSGISADGRFVGFSSRASDLVAADTNQVWDVFVRDRATTDTNAPTVKAPWFPFATPFPRDAASTAPSKVSWTTADLPGICMYSYALQVSIDGGRFETVPRASRTATSITREHASGHRYRYRVRATDCAGNTSPSASTMMRPGASG